MVKRWRGTTCNHSLRTFIVTDGGAVPSDLFRLEPIWRVWLEPICISCGSGDLIVGVEWILRPWSSWSASRISN